MIEPIKNIIYIARRFKLATAFNLLGLVVAFAACYLMMTQIIYQDTYNHGIEDCKRLYRLDTDFLNNNGLYSDKIFYPIAEVLDSMPAVESYSLMFRNNDDPVYARYYEQPFLTKDGDTIKFTCESLCNETAVSTLTSRALSGRIQWNEEDSYSDRPGVIIPASIAIDYFDSTHVAGQTMTAIFLDGNYPWKIRGVYEDFPKNSELRNCIYEIMHDSQKGYYKYNLNPSFKCIIKFKQPVSEIEALNQRMKQAIYGLMEKEGWEKYVEKAEMSVPMLQQAINDMHIRLTPLRDSYFETKSLNSSDHGFKPMLFILELACLLLVIIAAIHFLNFNLAESPMRIRGINTRLILGASRRSLQRGIIAECIITAIIACLLALAICGALSHHPTIDQLVDGSLSPFKHWLLSISMLILAGVVGFLVGLYPATFITSFVPAMALKGNFGITPQGHKLRKALITFQLLISFIMVIYLGILIQERNYIFHSDYRYNKNQVFMSTVPITARDSVKQELYKELMAIPGVMGASFSDGSLGLSDFHVSQLIETQRYSISFDYSYVDTAFLRTMGIGIIDGRDFLPTDTAAVILNLAAKQEWKWMKIGMRIPPASGQDSLTVVGFCDNIRYNTTRIESNRPYALICETHSNRYNLHMSLDKEADVKAVNGSTDAILTKHFGKEAQPLMPFDKKLNESYEDELRFFKWIFILSLVCTFITLIGVFCLTLFESEYRRKEIGIRKIAGATTGEVVLMLCRQYIPLILLSFALAVPVAIFCGRQTLAYFSEHTTILWWIFPLALAIVGGIVMTTILLQSWRTARENPVNSIKTE